MILTGFAGSLFKISLYISSAFSYLGAMNTKLYLGKKIVLVLGKKIVYTSSVVCIFMFYYFSYLVKYKLRLLLELCLQEKTFFMRTISVSGHLFLGLMLFL